MVFYSKSFRQLKGTTKATIMVKMVVVVLILVLVTTFRFSKLPDLHQRHLEYDVLGDGADNGTWYLKSHKFVPLATRHHLDDDDDARI